MMSESSKPPPMSNQSLDQIAAKVSENLCENPILVLVILPLETMYDRCFR